MNVSGGKYLSVLTLCGYSKHSLYCEGRTFGRIKRVSRAEKGRSVILTFIDYAVGRIKNVSSLDLGDVVFLNAAFALMARHMKPYCV